MGRADGVRFAPAQPGVSGWKEYADIAAELTVSVRTLQRWIATGSVPSPEYHGSLARFPLDYSDSILENGPSLPGTYTRAPSVRAAGKARSLKPVPTKRNAGKGKGKPGKGKSRTRVARYGKDGAK